MPLQFNNYSKPQEETLASVKQRPEYYKWRVFVDEDEGTLDRIDKVTYILHPTFRDPVRVVSSRESKFALESAGWGSFSMIIRIQYKDGKEEEQKYYLDLNKEWPPETVLDKSISSTLVYGQTETS